MYQKDKSSDSKVKFRQTSNRCKRVLEDARHGDANKTKLPSNLALVTFGELLIVFLSKGNSAIPLLSNGPEVLSSAFDKAKLFPESFSNNSNRDDSGISVPVFLSRTNLKLHNMQVPIWLKRS